MKKLNYFLVIAFASTMFACCSGDKKNNALIFTNDIDQIIGWGQRHPSIVKGDAHSGNYMCKIDSAMLYNYGLFLLVEDFPIKNVKFITASVWGKVVNINNNISLVMDIVAKDGTHIAFTGILFKEFIKTANKWGKVDGLIKVPPELPIGADLRIYVYNPSKDIGYLDDYEILFSAK